MPPFDVAAELKAKIARENDEDRRTTLMLLLGVFEANLAGIEALAKKIDALRGDEQGLREAVLNGHNLRHDKHHDWIEERMASDCEIGCEWAAKKMREEAKEAADAKENARLDKRAARDALIRQGVVVLLTVATTIIGTVWVIK